MAQKYKIVHIEDIKNGIKLNDTFSLIKKYKKYKNSKPLILMGYYQLIYNYGEKKFIKNVKVWVSLV